MSRGKYAKLARNRHERKRVEFEARRDLQQLELKRRRRAAAASEAESLARLVQLQGQLSVLTQDMAPVYAAELETEAVKTERDLLGKRLRAVVRVFMEELARSLGRHETRSGGYMKQVNKSDAGIDKQFLVAIESVERRFGMNKRAEDHMGFLTAANIAAEGED